MRKVVIFGASGDLAKRKLFPALAAIATEELEVIGYGRSDLSNTFHKILKETCEYEEEFLKRVTYVRGEYNDLSSLLDALNHNLDNTVYYLSLPPKVYPIVLQSLESFPASSVGIEKPFGEKSEAFSDIRRYQKHKLFFVDHYLIKPAMIAWPFVVTSSSLLSCISENCIQSAEARFCESILVENEKHFGSVGIIADVMQNHLTEVFAEAASRICRNTSRCNAISSLKFQEGSLRLWCYETYSPSHESTTPITSSTAAAWDMSYKGIFPVRFVGGKAFSEKEVSVRFRLNREASKRFIAAAGIERKFYDHYLTNADLVFYVYPENGIVLRVNNVSRTIISQDVMRAHMTEKFGLLRGHGIIFHALLKDEDFPSPSKEEVAAAWELYDSVTKTTPHPEVSTYSPGSDVKELLII